MLNTQKLFCIFADNLFVVLKGDHFVIHQLLQVIGESDVEILLW